jgi:YHS domain-containing protein
MNRHIRTIFLVAVLAVGLVVGITAQQKSADTAIDPVCGMTVVKANAKATFDHMGTTYYFCSTGCKEAFAKEPEKYLKAKPQAKPAMSGAMGGMMHGMHQGAAAEAPEAAGAGYACQGGCPMMGQGMGMMGGMGQMMGRPRMGMKARGMGRPGPGMMAPALSPLFRLYGDKIEVAVENAKDGAALKITSKDPEVVKAIQVHVAEHVAMLKKMREAAAKAATPSPAIK